MTKKEIVSSLAVVIGACLFVWGASRGVIWMKETAGWDSDTNRQIRIEKKLDEIDGKVERILYGPNYRREEKR